MSGKFVLSSARDRQFRADVSKGHAAQKEALAIDHGLTRGQRGTAHAINTAQSAASACCANTQHGGILAALEPLVNTALRTGFTVGTYQTLID